MNAYPINFEVDCEYDVESKEEAEIEGMIPIPKIIQVTQFGEIIVKWSTDMQVVGNLESLTETDPVTKLKPIEIIINPGSDFT